MAVVAWAFWLGLRRLHPPEAQDVAKDVAMHVAASDPTPLAVDRSGVDASVVEKEKEILRNQALASGKTRQNCREYCQWPDQ